MGSSLPLFMILWQEGSLVFRESSFRVKLKCKMSYGYTVYTVGNDSGYLSTALVTFSLQEVFPVGKLLMTCQSWDRVLLGFIGVDFPETSSTKYPINAPYLLCNENLLTNRPLDLVLNFKHTYTKKGGSRNQSIKLSLPHLSRGSCRI